MESIIAIGQWLLVNWSTLLNAIVAVLTALIALFMLIPGDQPEKALQSVVNFIQKFSKK